MSPPFPIPVTNFATSAASPSIITAGLELHLDAGDASSYPGSGTTWFDLTANNYDFTFVGTPSYTATPGYFNFGYGSVAANRATNTDTIAITTGAFEMWFRWRAGSALASTIIAAYPSSWCSLGHSTGTYPDEAWEYNAASNPTMDYRNSHTHFRDGQWYHIVAVIDGIANQLYVDGAPVATTFRLGSAVSTGLWAGAQSAIGNQYGGGGYQFDSDIAIMRLYDAATFSAADVLNNYTVEQARFKTFWPDSVDSLRLWIDPSAADTVTLGVAPAIDYILDQARRVATARIESSGASDPTLVSAGGMNWMEFNGVDQYFQAKDSGGATISISSFIVGAATGWEMHAVIDSDTATGVSLTNPYSNNGIIMDSGGYWGICAAVDPGDVANVRIQPNAYDGGGSHWTDYDIPKNEKHIFGVSYAGGASTDLITYIDGATTTVPGVAASAIPSSTSSRLQVGKGYSALYYNGLIGEICIFDAPLTPTDRAALLAYLKAKWGTP